MPRLSRVEQGIDGDALFTPLDEFARLGLAVSGGADSLALMLLAHRFAAPRALLDRFIVYTVDHGLRPEAAAEAAFVVEEAQKRGFTARSLRWEGRKPATAIQEAARRARYQLIATAMQVDGAEALLTAHHLDDQAETVLMRLAHGSGLEGLRGMDYLSVIGGLTVIRPLLGIDPIALRQVVADAGLTPVVDPSNTAREYERVRWRQMLPQLAELGLTPRRLARFAERARDADRAIALATAAAWHELREDAASTRIEFDRSFLQALPRAVAIRIVERALGRVGSWRKPHALAAVETLTDRLRREPLRATLHGCIVSGGTRRISIRPEPARAASRSKEPTVL